jgi:hypothetical protein
MKILFLATVACLVLSLSSSAQAQKARFSDQYCVPYCTGHCRDVSAGRTQPANPTVKAEDSFGSDAYRNACRCVASWAISGHFAICRLAAVARFA